MEVIIHNTTLFKDFEVERTEKMKSLCSDSSYTEKQFLDLLTAANRNEKNILDALTYAKQLDFSKNYLKSSYLSHPLRLASYLLKVVPDIPADYIVIALLHNVPETTTISITELQTLFGNEVASGISTLLVDRSAHFPSIQKSYYEAIFSNGTYLVLVKLLDKIDNLFVLCLNPDDAVREAYLEEVREELLPFAIRYYASLGKYLDLLLTATATLGYSDQLKQTLLAYQQSVK